MYICMYICIYVYMYIRRERESEKAVCTYGCMSLGARRAFDGGGG